MIYPSPAIPARRRELLMATCDSPSTNSYSSISIRKLREDQALLDDLEEDNVPAFRAGYCEWATSRAGQIISIGWAWFGVKDARICLARVGSVATSCC
jgi:hypothetical protein